MDIKNRFVVKTLNILSLSKVRSGLIIAVMLLALGLRLYGINANLPLLLTDDEPLWVPSGMEIGESLLPQALGTPGTPYVVILGLGYLLCFVVSQGGAWIRARRSGCLASGRRHRLRKGYGGRLNGIRDSDGRVRHCE